MDHQKVGLSMAVAMRSLKWFRSGTQALLWLLVGIFLGLITPSAKGATDSGMLVEVPLPLDELQSRKLIDQLDHWAQEVPQAGERLTVVLKIGGPGGRDTRFEPSLALARWLTSPAAVNLRTVAWIVDTVEGHAILPVLACEQLVSHPEAKFGPASVAEDASDLSIGTFYRSIAERRARIPVEVIDALLDDKLELAALAKVEGTWEIASGKRLDELRASGAAWKELVLSNAGQPTIITGSQLRELRWASHLVGDVTDLSNALEVLRWKTSDKDEPAVRVGARLEVRGVIHRRMADRFERDLLVVTEKANTVIVHIDSPGGDFNSSLRMSEAIHAAQKQGILVIGFIDNEARSNAALIATSCKRLVMAETATIGGAGENASSKEEIEKARAEIEDLLAPTEHNEALLVSLLNPEFPVAQFTDEKIGRVSYFNPETFAQRKDFERWRQGETLSTAEGFVGSRARELRLADSEGATLESVADSVGLATVPELYQRKDLVEWVEGVGRKTWISYLLLFIGMLALAIESGTPGVGFPGLVGITAMGGFIWIQYLNGTAEWLEVMLLIAGIGCLALELLVLPGFGVFGIGGMLMIVAAIVLISQTFVFPQNDYQYMRTAKGLGGVVIAAAGVAVGFFILQRYLASTPGLKHLMMPESTPDEVEQRERRESLALLDELVGQIGIATTPLVPSGKIRIGNRTIDVVASGMAVDRGAQVRVTQVHGSRVLVEPLT